MIIGENVHNLDSKFLLNFDKSTTFKFPSDIFYRPDEPDGIIMNSEFVLEDGILFNADKTELIYYPANVESRDCYKIPDTVYRMDAYAMAKSKIGTVIMPKAFGGINYNFAFTSSKIKNYVFSDTSLLDNYGICCDLGINCEEYGSDKKIYDDKEITFYCNKNSSAYEYAQANGYTIRPLSEAPGI